MPTLGTILPNFREKQAMTLAAILIVAYLLAGIIYTLWDNWRH